MRVSHTKLTNFSCKRRGYYIHELAIEPVDASELSLIYGAAVHVGLKTLMDKAAKGEGENGSAPS